MGILNRLKCHLNTMDIHFRTLSSIFQNSNNVNTIRFTPKTVPTMKRKKRKYGEKQQTV